MSAVCIVPVHRSDPIPLVRTVDEAAKHCRMVIVVANCREPAPQLREAVASDRVVFLDAGRCLGKAEAIRVGLRHAVRGPLPSAVVQLDATLKIPPSIVPDLLSGLAGGEASMVVANRYAHRDLHRENHRLAATSIFRSIARNAGSDTPDPFCGTRAYTADLGMRMLEYGVSKGYGIEFEQLLIAAETCSGVMDVPAPAVGQDPFTDGEKVVDTLDVIVSRLPASKGAILASGLRSAIRHGLAYSNDDFEIGGTAVEFTAVPVPTGSSVSFAFQVSRLGAERRPGI